MILWQLIYSILCLVLIFLTMRWIINKQSKFLLPQSVNTDEENLLRFSTTKRIQPPPSTIDIENPYACTAEDLRKCDTNNMLSCVGCQNLLSTCVHFEDDTLMYPLDENDEISEDPVLIPKNDSADEGYCLIVKTVGESCSVHGQLVLIQISPDASETALICMCTEPGLIGNDTIDGNCTSLRICNGNVDDITKPIASLNCECPENFYSTRLEDGTPTCAAKTLLNSTAADVNSHVENLSNDNIRLAEIRHFNGNISQNLASGITSLPDPCATCPITGRSLACHVDSIKDLASFCSTDSPTNDVVLLKTNNPDGRIFVGNFGADMAIYGDWTYILSFLRQENVEDVIYVLEMEKNQHLKKYVSDQNAKYIFIRYDEENPLFGINILKDLLLSDRHCSKFINEPFTFTYASWLKGPFTHDRTESVTILRQRNLPILPNFQNDTVSQYLTNTICQFPWGCSDWNSIRNLGTVVFETGMRIERDGIVDDSFVMHWTKGNKNNAFFDEAYIRQFRVIGYCFQKKDNEIRASHITAPTTEMFNFITNRLVADRQTYLEL